MSIGHVGGAVTQGLNVLNKDGRLRCRQQVSARQQGGRNLRRILSQPFLDQGYLLTLPYIILTTQYLYTDTGSLCIVKENGG